MQTFTLIVNGAPYGTEGPYNAFRLSQALLVKGNAVNVFLMADAVLAAKKGQKVPQGYYNTEEMLAGLIARGATVRLCGTCSNARGMSAQDIVQGAAIGSMSELAQWVSRSDKVISF